MLIIVDVDLSVCAGQTLWGRWYSIRFGSFWDLFFLPRASGANFQKGLDQIVAGMWTIIQCTYLASRVLEKLFSECWNIFLLSLFK